MSSVITSKMAVGLRFARLFASLPPEIRDMVYAHLVNSKDHMVGFDKGYYVVSRGDRTLDTFLIMVHQKAFDSWAARELGGVTRLPQPGLVTTLETTDKEAQSTLYGTYPRVPLPPIPPISPKDVVAKLEMNIYECNELKYSNENDLCRLNQQLSTVFRFPRLRRAEISLWVPSDCDCYGEVMPLVESISITCGKLRRRFGNNLSIGIMRHWPSDDCVLDLMRYDISWMWEAPGQEVRMIQGVRAPTAAEDRVRTLLSVDIRPISPEKSILQELRDAASSFPQRREDIAVEDGGLNGMH